MKHDREISQRKSMNKSTITQARPSQQQQPQQQPQQHQQLQQHHPHHQLQQPGQQQPQPKQIANHDNKRKEAKQEEAAVTFAEHIRISDDDVKGRYVFGFFDEQRQQQSGNQAKPNKTTIKHNENSPFNNSNQAGQKHKLKYPKASLNSEQNRYKFNDNIDANSFNYHQILEFISNCKYQRNLSKSTTCTLTLHHVPLT